MARSRTLVRRRWAHLALLSSLYWFMLTSPPCPAQNTVAPTGIAIEEAIFHSRDRQDAGEARICFQNTSATALDTSQLKVQILARKSDNADSAGVEQKCLYARLLPPNVQAGQHGQLVVKLMERPPSGCTLNGTLSMGGGTPQAVPLAEPTLWISYVGVSQDRKKVFAYAENTSQNALDARLIAVNDSDASHRATTICVPIPPGEKGCLMCELTSPVATGEFVHVVLSVKDGSRESKVCAVVRPMEAVPVAMEDGVLHPALGLETPIASVQTMSCPAHNYGSHEAAATQFLNDYAQRFGRDPRQTIRMHICRSDCPRAWFRFGSLPDVATMNACLRVPVQDVNQGEGFCPFFSTSTLAKRAMEPSSYLALIPAGPDADGEGAFLLKNPTSQELRFVAYCALACGAKGVVYRGLPADDALSRDAFGQLNREFQYLAPLLVISDSVEWGATDDARYAARCLLCGDQALLVMVFDRRYFSKERSGRFYTPTFGREVKAVKVHVKMPQEVAAGQVRSLSGPLDHGVWVARAGGVDFTTDMIDSVQVYLVDLQRRTTVPSEMEALKL